MIQLSIPEFLSSGKARTGRVAKTGSISVETGLGTLFISRTNKRCEEIIEELAIEGYTKLEDFVPEFLKRAHQNGLVCSLYNEEKKFWALTAPGFGTTISIDPSSMPASPKPSIDLSDWF